MALEKDIERLSRAPLFRVMDPDALKLVAFAAETRVLRSADVLFRKGEPAEAAVLVVSGAIELTGSDPDAGVRRLAEAGALLSELALLAPTQHNATAIARTPSVVLKVSRAVFFRVLREYPGNAVHVRAYWASKLGRSVEALTTAVSP